MGSGDMIWNIFQQCQIRSLHESAEAVQRSVAQDQASMRGDISMVEEKLACLALICRALFEVIEEKGGITEHELAKRILEVDARDGTADGRMTAKARPCPACGSMMSPRFNRCLFCGQKDESGDPFNRVK